MFEEVHLVLRLGISEEKYIPDVILNAVSVNGITIGCGHQGASISIFAMKTCNLRSLLSDTLMLSIEAI